jgi:hypothetical protein
MGRPNWISFGTIEAGGALLSTAGPRLGPPWPPLPLLHARLEPDPAPRSCDTGDDVEVDLAVGDAAMLDDRPEGVEHRACDHEVRDQELRALDRQNLAAGLP